jgi:putative Mg2+ transporter-C (MgtC) family protein
MPLHPTWTDILARLALTLAASGAIGLDRESHRHTAGLRTTMLVGLAAALAMIQANVLLPVDGKTASSFSVLDLMRLPLGILTGVGFIGAGAILKREDTVSGVTTAATLWLTTVVGLCLGGGQLGLGVIGALLALVVLFGLRRLERRWTRHNRARLVIRVAKTLSPKQAAYLFEDMPWEVLLQEQAVDSDDAYKRLEYDLTWPKHDGQTVSDVLDVIGGQVEVVAFRLLA